MNFKTLTLVIISMTLLFGCGSVEKSMQRRLDKVYIGMPLSEFKKTVRKTSMVYLSEDYSCFKLRKSKAKFGAPSGFVYSTRFFYFQGDKLWKIDEGERAVDYRIRVDK